MYFVEGLNARLGSPGFAGTLGENPASWNEFLKQVRKQPKDHKKLLMIVTFHPVPLSSRFVNNLKPYPLIDMLVAGNIAEGTALDELRKIRDKFRDGDPGFKQELDAELRLRNEMIKMAGALGPEKLRPFLIEPLFPPASFRREIDPWMLRRLGFEFAVKMLPKEFVRRLIGSEASEAHFTSLGKFLRRNGKDLQTKDPGFKQLVERQRTLRRLKPEQMPE